MRRPAAIAVLVVALVSIDRANAADPCPIEPPRPAVGLALAIPCGRTVACPNGPLSMSLQPLASGFFPPAEYDPGYRIQPCDTVLWQFGDGTSRAVMGTAEMTHTYPIPGNYDITVTVENAMGRFTALVARSLVVADAPARVQFVTPGAPYPYPYCSHCVAAKESDGQVSITVVRTGDLTRSISVGVVVFGRHAGAMAHSTADRLTFAPGETTRSFLVSLDDDDLYYGPRWYPLMFTDPAGGVLTHSNVFPGPFLFVADDDPQPTCSIAARAEVREGDSGRTPLSVPVRLTAPMLVDVATDVFYHYGSAGSNDFIRGTSLRIPAGETMGYVDLWVAGDTEIEADEFFTIQLFPGHTNNDPLFGNQWTTVTIVNDDPAAAAALPVPTLNVQWLIVLALAVGASAFVALGRS